MKGAPIELGTLLPTRAAREVAPILAFAQRAEELGFDSLWAGESILARPRLDPLTTLAAVAARTTRARIGTAVLLPAQHQPLRLAHVLATLDCISEGRLIAGLGLGIKDERTLAEFRGLGVPPDSRAGRAVECVRLCRTLWSTSPEARRADAPGRRTPYWNVEDAELLCRPHQPAGPPFWSGSTFRLEASLRRTGRHFDGWFPTAPTADAYRQGWEAVQEAAARAGRDAADLSPAVYLTVHLDSDPANAQRSISEFIESYYGVPYAAMSQVQGCYAGDAEGCAEWIRGFAAAGARHVVLRFGARDAAVQLERVAKDLLPLLPRSDHGLLDESRTSGAAKAAS